MASSYYIKRLSAGPTFSLPLLRSVIMPNEVSSLRKKEVQVLFVNSCLVLPWSYLIVLQFTYNLTLVSVLRISPCLWILAYLAMSSRWYHPWELTIWMPSWKDLDRIGNAFWAFSSTNLVITMNLHLSVNFLLQGTHLGNLWNTDWSRHKVLDTFGGIKLYNEMEGRKLEDKL